MRHLTDVEVNHANQGVLAVGPRSDVTRSQTTITVTRTRGGGGGGGGGDSDPGQYNRNGNPNYPTIQQVGNEIFNELRSLSGDGIQQALVDIAHVIYNQQGHEPATASASANPSASEQAFYNMAQQAAQQAYQEYTGYVDPTNGATNFNLRSNDSTSPFQGAVITTHNGPFNNSYPQGGLPASGVYVNTYRAGG